MCNTLEGNINVINNSIKVYIFLRKNVKYSELMTIVFFICLAGGGPTNPNFIFLSVS